MKTLRDFLEERPVDQAHVELLKSQMVADLLANEKAVAGEE